MAFFDRFKRNKQVESEKFYDDNYKDDKMDENLKKRSKRRKGWLIGLTAAAVVATVAFPFLIGFAAASAGVVGASLTAAGVTAGVVALAVDIAAIGAWVKSSASRKAGRDAKKIKQASENHKVINTNDLKSQTSRRALVTYISNIVGKAEIDKKQNEITIEKLLDSVKIGDGVNKDLINAIKGEKTPGADKSIWTSDNIKMLIEGITPSDAKAASQFKSVVKSSKPWLFDGNVITTDDKDNVTGKYSVVITDKVYTDQAKYAYQAVLSYINDAANKANGTDFKMTQGIGTKDRAVKGRNQEATYNTDKYTRSIRSLAIYEAGQEQGVTESKPTPKERIISLIK